MKKYMLADFEKDLSQYDIDRFMRYYDVSEQELPIVLSLKEEYRLLDIELEKAFQMYMLMRDYQINSDEAYYLVENWDNEADWKLVMETSEALGSGIEDIEDDDVEEYISMGKAGAGTFESDSSLIKWIYDNSLKAYLILMMFGDRPVMYKISPDMMHRWKNYDSKGLYYNLNIRGNTQIEDPDHSCGCGPNPCEDTQVDEFNTRFNSIA